MLTELRYELVENLRFLRAEGLRGSKEQYLLARAVTAYFYLDMAPLLERKNWQKANEIAQKFVENQVTIFELLKSSEFRTQLTKILSQKVGPEEAECFINWSDNEFVSESFDFWNNIDRSKINQKAAHVLAGLGELYNMCASGAGMKLVACFRKLPIEDAVEYLEQVVEDDYQGIKTFELSADQVIGNQTRIGNSMRNYLDKLRTDTRHEIASNKFTSYLRETNKDMSFLCLEVLGTDFGSIQEGSSSLSAPFLFSCNELGCV